MSISNITNQLLNKIIDELKTKNNIEKIKENVVNPMVHYTVSKLYPYILITSIFFLIFFILAIITLFLMVKLSFKT
jgi:hypothetical protein